MPAWTPAALADHEAITDYIAQDSPRAAVELGDRLIERAGQLDAFPELGRVGRVRGTRELVVHEHYVLVYRLLENRRAQVLRVLHTAQQWPPR